ncbi:unnamed protein product [Rhizoctonia solani]|uniref:HMG box domain-containing protein n=1 Tax=Rhizoctonia solani TaxID=456999 RepID=A0A8H3E3K7_9AGAM|nr:unnamed protein product [Rhizoctonia solani]
MPTINNEASLRAFPKFQLLGDHIKSIVIQMLKDDRLNNYGGLKRPPNAWLIFRSTLAATSEMRSLSQAEITSRCKARWVSTTPEERMVPQARARRANHDLLQYFPDYSYKPMSAGEKERWKALGAYQRKEFWLSSAVRIAERIAHPNQPWGGFLTLEKWAKDQAPVGSIGTSHNALSAGLGLVHPPEARRTSQSIPPPPTRLASRSERICNTPRNGSTRAPSPSANQLGVTSTRFHPYSRGSTIYGSPTKSSESNQAPIRSQVFKKTLPPDPLRGVLVHIGPQAHRTQRRQLVMSMFQLKDKIVWVSEEVDDDVPDDIFKHLSSSMSPDEASPDHLVLHDYTDPWIPQAMDEYGELFSPEIRTVSEYHEYMSSHHFSQENSLDFVWPPPSRSSSTSLSAPLYPSPVGSNILEDPALDFSTEISPPAASEPGTNLSSDSDSDSIKTPEECLGWDEPIFFGNTEDFDYEGLESFEFESE